MFSFSVGVLLHLAYVRNRGARRSPLSDDQINGSKWAQKKEAEKDVVQILHGR
jgi:hypothetical protein